MLVVLKLKDLWMLLSALEAKFSAQLNSVVAKLVEPERHHWILELPLDVVLLCLPSQVRQPVSYRVKLCD